MEALRGLLYFISVSKRCKSVAKVFRVTSGDIKPPPFSLRVTYMYVEFRNGPFDVT